MDVLPEPVSSLECVVDDTSVSLTWSNGSEDYTSIDVLRDGSVIANLAGTDTSYDDLDLADGSYDYEVQPIRGGFVGPAVSCTVRIGEGPLFVRGDVTNNGNVDLADTISALKYQFRNGRVPDCLVAADVNDDGRVNIADAIVSLTYLFLDGPEPSSPFPDCGLDPEPDLDCDDPRDC